MTTRPPNPGIQVEQIGDVLVATFTRSSILEDATIRALGDQLNSLVDALGHRKLVLNFRAVRRLSSPMLAKLVTLRQKVQGAGGRVVLCGLDRDLYPVFEMTQFTKLFPIYPGEQEALQSF